MAITVAQLGDALGVPKDSAGALSTEDSAELQRLLDYATALITAEAMEAPDAYKDLATQALVGYLYDRPTSERGTGYANAWINSGAANILKRYVQRRVFTIGEVAGAATQVASGSLDVAAVNDAIADTVTGAFVVALLTALQAGDRLSLDATDGSLPASRITGLSAGSTVTDAHIKSLVADFAEQGNPALAPSDKIGPVGTDATLTVHASRVRERLDNLDEFEAAWRRTSVVVDETNPALVIGVAFRQYAVGGASPAERPPVPAQTPDAELTVTVAGLGMQRLDLSALSSKPALSLSAVMSSSNAVAFQLGAVTFYLGRSTEMNHFRIGADTAGTYGVTIQLSEIDVKSFARKSSTDLIGSADLEVNQRLPAPEDDQFLKWASGALVNTDAPSGGTGGLSQEQVEDAAAGLLTKGDDLATADIDAVYDDDAATVALQVKEGVIRPAELNVSAGAVGGRFVKFNAGYTGFEGATDVANPFASELRNSVLGIAIANTQGNVQQTLTALTAPYTLGDQDHGVLLVKVTWQVPASSQSQLALGDDVTDTNLLFLSDLRATDAYLGGTSAKNGLIAGTVDVHRVVNGQRSVKAGEVTLYVAKDADDNIGTYLAYATSAGSFTASAGSIQAQVEIALLRTDYSVPAASGGAAPTPVKIFEVAPSSGFVTDFAKGAMEPGWGSMSEPDRVNALNQAQWIYGAVDTVAAGATTGALASPTPFVIPGTRRGALDGTSGQRQVQYNGMILIQTTNNAWQVGFVILIYGYNAQGSAFTTLTIYTSLGPSFAAPVNNRFRRLEVWTL